MLNAPINAPEKWNMDHRRRQPGWPRALGGMLLAGMLLAGLSGCGGSASRFQVHEYAIVEQSADNPTHVEFQQRVQAVVSARQAGWHFPGLQDPIQGPNQALASFGYQLQGNPTPPFSGYALYHHGQLVQRDITRFWPVSLKTGARGSAGSDFLLTFETMSGQRLVASLDGIHPWPVKAQVAYRVESATPPVYLGSQIAYAQTSGPEVSVFAGSGLLYNSAAPSGAADGSSQHWALELNGHVIQDGRDINIAYGYDAVFQWRVLDGQPFYFYTKDGLTHLNDAGRDLPYIYDRIVDGSPLAIFNPGDNGQIVWFDALRDGVWYYVEAGYFH